MPRQVLFAHGLESGPVGRKSQALLDAGLDLVAPDCRDRDLEERVQLLRAAIAAAREPPVLVGSSFGGIAGLCAAITADAEGHRVAGIVLCAPALHLSELPPSSLRPPAPTEIVHGRADDIVPIEVSREYAHRFGVPLHEVDDDHRLAGPGLAVIVDVVRRMVEPPALLVVDAANVVGSVPDGWWRDRAGAAARLRDAMVDVAARGLASEAAPSALRRGPIDVVLVVEGAAKRVAAVPGVRVVAALGSGDDAIVDLVADEGAGRACYVATADRELTERVRALGATVIGPRSVRR